MTGGFKHVYIHVPFCRQICYYCDYHSRASTSDKEAVLAAMNAEIRKVSEHTENNTPVETLYFGGGTPSILTIEELSQLFDTAKKNFILSPDAEITLEANPDDLTDNYLENILRLGINRLSIGVQSFFDDDLRWMNRRHDAKEAVGAVKKSQKHGFHNINIDIIYGLPSMTMERWQTTLELALELEAPHLSAYHLIVEERSVFGRRERKGEIFDVSEEASLRQFCALLDASETAGYEHYEISNFARDGFRSQHNTAHWLMKPYIGIGPSAHSFDGASRQWNINNNSKYMSAIANDKGWFEREILTVAEQYNEYVLSSLRAVWGVDISHISAHFGNEFVDYFIKNAATYLSSGYMQEKHGIFSLTRKGKMTADRIASDLFKI